MSHAQPSDNQIKEGSDARFVIHIPRRPGIACIEKRGDMWDLDLLAPNEKGCPDIVRAYFTGKAPKDISIEHFKVEMLWRLLWTSHKKLDTSMGA